MSRPASSNNSSISQTRRLIRLLLAVDCELSIRTVSFAKTHTLKAARRSPIFLVKVELVSTKRHSAKRPIETGRIMERSLRLNRQCLARHWIARQSFGSALTLRVFNLKVTVIFTRRHLIAKKQESVLNAHPSELSLAARRRYSGRRLSVKA